MFKGLSLELDKYTIDPKMLKMLQAFRDRCALLVVTDSDYNDMHAFAESFTFPSTSNSSV